MLQMRAVAASALVVGLMLPGCASPPPQVSRVVAAPTNIELEEQLDCPAYQVRMDALLELLRRDAGPALVRALDHRRRDVAVRAEWLLRLIRPESAIHSLIDRLDDTPAASRVIGCYGEALRPHAGELITAMSYLSDEALRTVAGGVVQVVDDALARKVAANRDPIVRRLLAERLAPHPLQPGLSPEVARELSQAMLHDADPSVRATAVLSLYIDVIDVTRTLSDPVREVRLAAIQSLGIPRQYSGKELLPAVGALLTMDDAVELRLLLVALAHGDLGSLLPALAGQVAADTLRTSSPYRAATIALLAEHAIDYPPGVTAICKYAQAGNVDAIFALGWIPARAAGVELLRLAQSHDPLIQLPALFALGGWRDQFTVDVLAGVLAQPVSVESQGALRQAVSSACRIAPLGSDRLAPLLVAVLAQQPPAGAGASSSFVADSHALCDVIAATLSLQQRDGLDAAIRGSADCRSPG
ncbi:MAG: hypothetical protein AB7K09_19085, partial [Planctomycetota bacterium]